MIREMEGTGKFIAIAGFRGVQIKDIDDLLNVARVKGACIQFFDADLIASQKHLFFAALNALKAFESKTNISDSLAVEILLFASAQRQIRKAVELLGIKPGSSRIAVLVLAETQQDVAETLEIVYKMTNGELDDGVLKLNEEKFEAIKRLFHVTDSELEAKLEKEGLEKEALINLVIEHVALLATQR